jgi:hypothetical protein
MDLIPQEQAQFLDTALNIGLAIILMLYVLISVLIIRQVQLMSKVIITGVNKYVYLLVLAHLIFAVFISIVIMIAVI